MTIRHTVFFKLHPGIPQHDPRVLTARALSETHHNHIEEIRCWWAGPNTSHRDIAYDYMVMGTFETQEDLQRYLDHPHHQHGARLWAEISSWVIVDIDEASCVKKQEGPG